jgi:hypothetical protein
VSQVILANGSEAKYGGERKRLNLHHRIKP